MLIGLIGLSSDAYKVRLRGPSILRQSVAALRECERPLLAVVGSYRNARNFFAGCQLRIPRQAFFVTKNVSLLG